MIDLHAHTTASDGTFSPRQLVQLAREKGLSAVAVTDHDTFDGWPEAFDAAREVNVEVVPGIELSVSDASGKYHLLGYYVSPQSELGEALEWVRTERATRNERIAAKLNEIGVPFSFERVRQIAGGATMGRPHFAQALLESGAVSSVQEAFDEYLADGARAHIGKAVLEPARAIELIHRAGGAAIWAHPLRPPGKRAARPAPGEVRALLERWKAWGADGFEVFYGDYSPEEARWMREAAAELKMLGTGGSDFHGSVKPGIELGRVNGGQSVPAAALDELKAGAARWQ